MELDTPAEQSDWEALPLPALQVLASRFLQLTDIEAASRVCKQWNSALNLHRSKVLLLPLPKQQHTAPSAPPHTNAPAHLAPHPTSHTSTTPRPTATERYPPHLFNTHTGCWLPLSANRIATSDPHDLAIFSQLLAAYARSSLTILADTSADDAYASSTYSTCFSNAKADARAAARAAATAIANVTSAAAAATMPSPAAAAAAAFTSAMAPYYSLSAPLAPYLSSLMSGQAGAHIRRLSLHLTAMPSPQLLRGLALLPSLRHLALLGGSGAVLNLAHLDTLAGLHQLQGLELCATWDLHKAPGEGAVEAGGPGAVAGDAGGAGGGAGQAVVGLADDVIDLAGDDDDGEVEEILFFQGGGGGAWGDPHAGAGDEGIPGFRWAVPAVDHFAQLEHLVRLELRALPPAGGHGSKVRLELRPCTQLQELCVSGWQLQPGLADLSHLQQLSRLVTDRVLGVEEWAAVRNMEGLREVDLRAEVAGGVMEPVVLGNSVEVGYGGHRASTATGRLSFPLPAALGALRSGSRAAGVAGAGGAGGAGGAVQENLFAAAGASSTPQARAALQEKLRSLAELHVRLEPIRFISDLTSLTRLALRWPAAGRQWGRGSWTEEEARTARRPYSGLLAAMTEIRDAEVDCPGGELVLDGGLLAALAPAWRRLRRLVFRGCVLLGAQAAQQLAPFKELQELALHDTGAVGSSSTTGGLRLGPSAQGQDAAPHPKLILMTAQLPAGLQRLALTNANVLHVPRVGARKLQRLELGERCRWQTAPAPPGAGPAGGAGGAGGSAVLPSGPWVLPGLSLLSHLRLVNAPLSAAELAALLGSCGSQLRSLTLHVPSDKVDLLCSALLGAGSLPHLRHIAHLDLDVGWPAPPGSSSAAGGGVAAGVVDLVDSDEDADAMDDVAWQPHPGGEGHAAGGQVGGGGAVAVRAEHAVAAEASRGLVPVRRMLAALLAAAQAGVDGAGGVAGGGAAGSGLVQLRELVLRLPEVRMRPVEHTQQERRRQADALREQLLLALGPLGQLLGLHRLEVELRGSTPVGLGAALERQLLEQLAHCHVAVRQRQHGTPV